MIRRTLTVRVPPERAFRAWTHGVDLWWPPSHRQLGSGSTLQIEGFEGGRFVETHGEQVLELGRVVRWEPPARLVYDFYPGSGAAEPTRVDVRFNAVSGGTRVDIEHTRHLLPPARWERNNRGYDRAWTHLVEVLQTALEEL